MYDHQHTNSPLQGIVMFLAVIGLLAIFGLGMFAGAMLFM